MTICDLLAALEIIYFCANELAIAPLNKGGKEMMITRKSKLRICHSKLIV